MKTFEQAKDEVAKKHGYDSYLNYLLTGSIADMSTYLHEAAELYANSKAEQAWEEGLQVGLKAFENDAIPHNPYK